MGNGATGARGAQQSRARAYTAPAKGTGSKSGSKAPNASAKESVHEQAARLRAEQGLPAETTWASAAKDRNGDATLAPRSVNAGLRTGDVPDYYAPGATEITHLASLYGEENLGVALHGYSSSHLNAAARDMGVKPSSSKAETISRIVTKATNGRYTAEDQVKAAAADKSARAAAKANAPAKAPRAASGSKSTKSAKAAEFVPTPVGKMSEAEYNTWRGIKAGSDANRSNRTLNPYFTQALYGQSQLRPTLAGYSMPVLREAAGVVSARIKATTGQDVKIGGTSKDALVANIASAVAQHPSDPFFAG